MKFEENSQRNVTLCFSFISQHLRRVCNVPQQKLHDDDDDNDDDNVNMVMFLNL